MGQTKTYPQFRKMEIDSAKHIGVWAIFDDGEEASIGTVRNTRNPVTFQIRARELYDDQRHHWEKK